jgi:hypothetical protein
MEFKMTEEVMDKKYYKNLERDALNRILQRRKDKKNGFRKFASKEEEYETMIREANECVQSIFDNNQYYYEKEINCKYFRYTPNDIDEIEQFFENANENFDLVKHSPVWEKHQTWMELATENNDHKPDITTKKYVFKKQKY